MMHGSWSIQRLWKKNSSAQLAVLTVLQGGSETHPYGIFFRRGRSMRCGSISDLPFTCGRHFFQLRIEKETARRMMVGLLVNCIAVSIQLRRVIGRSRTSRG